MINIEILKQSPHAKSQDEILRDYQSDPEKGLTPEEAALRQTILTIVAYETYLVY